MIARITARSHVFELFFCALLFAGCGGGEQAGTTNGDGPVVGVSVLTMTHPFFLKLVAALEEEAEAQGIEVVLVTAEFDVAKQKNQISDFIVQGVDAIIMSPADSKAIGPSVKEANEAGVPVFTADIAVLVDDVEVVGHVGIDNYAGGRQAGELALSLLEGSGTIAIIDHPEVESVIQRTRGFVEAIEAGIADGAAVEIVATVPGRGSQDQSFRATEDVLQAHGQLDVIFGINDETALGALAAVEKAGREEVAIIGFGGKEEAIAAVEAGKLYADIITYPDEIGRIAIRNVATYMAGEPVPPTQLLSTEAFTQED